MDLDLSARKPQIFMKNERKAIIAGSIGNALEFYDWVIYAFFAPVIAHLFFPASSSTAGLLATFGVFAVGFIMRPIGAIVMGPYGDKVGRKNLLSLCVIIMSISTFLIGILPTYGQVGILAPILLVIVRCIQGFSVGAEAGGSTSFLVEFAPKGKRGLYGSFQQFSTLAGNLLGSIIANIFIFTMSTETLHAWGWRVPFIVGIFLGIIGLYLRLKIEETPKFKQLESQGQVVKQPIREMLKNPRPLLNVVGFMLATAVSYYVLLNYLPAYVKEVLHLPHEHALLANMIILAFMMLLTPFIGALSDRIGRKPLLLTSCAGVAILTYPMMTLLGKSFISMLLPQLALIFFLVLFAGASPAMLAEITPTRTRNTTISVGYNISNALFGGTAPFMATLMVGLTGNKFSPAILVAVAAAITFIVLLGIKDRYMEEELQ